MKNVFAFTFLVLFLLTGCGQDRMSDADAMGIDPAAATTTPAPGVEPAPVRTGSEEITATFLDDYPAEVGGCDCTLFLDSNDSELFFVFNRDEGVGVIGLNGERMVVQRGASLSQKNASYDSYLHENNAYKIQSSLTSEGPSGDEGKMYSGKLKITDKISGAKSEFIVNGTCGC